MIGWLWDSLRTRLIVSAALGLLLGLVFAGSVLLGVYRDAAIASLDDRLGGFAGSIISVAEFEPDTGLYLLREVGEATFESAYSGWYWQVVRAGPAKPPVPAVGAWAAVPALPQGPPEIVLRSRSLFDFALPPPELWEADRGFTTGPLGERLRVIRTRVHLPRYDGDIEVWVAANYAVVERSVAGFTRALGMALLILAAGIGLAVTLQMWFALSPLKRLRAALHAVREGQADRLEGTYLKEIEPLTRELNALLAHNEQVLSRARTEVGNLAHALKTPLSVLRGEAESGTSSLADTVRREVQKMHMQVDHHLKRARAAAAANYARARTPVLPRVEALVRAMEKIHRERGIEFTYECAPLLVFRGEAQDLEEIIGNLLDNAGKWAKSRVRFKALPAANGRFVLSIEDDGPGLTEEERARVQKRGERLDESVPGTGLGLAIVKDMVGLYGGELVLGAADLGGLKVSVWLPASQPNL